MKKNKRPKKKIISLAIFGIIFAFPVYLTIISLLGEWWFYLGQKYSQYTTIGIEGFNAIGFFSGILIGMLIVFGIIEFFDKIFFKEAK